MKKLYIFAITVLMASASSEAQNLVYPQGQHLVETIVNTSFEYWTIDITTPTPEAITFNWTLISNTIPASWDYALCDYTNCHIGIPQSGVMSAISLNQAQNFGTVGFLKVNVTANLNYGNGKVVFYVYDSNNINRGDTISLTINYPNTVGINENMNQSLVSFYPNPAKNNVQFNNDSDENINFSIYNSLGKLILNQIVLSNQSSSEDVSELNSGVYFVSFIDKKGMKQIHKLIIQ